MLLGIECVLHPPAAKRAAAFPSLQTFLGAPTGAAEDVGSKGNFMQVMHRLVSRCLLTPNSVNCDPTNDYKLDYNNCGSSDPLHTISHRRVTIVKSPEHHVRMLVSKECCLNVSMSTVCFGAYFMMFLRLYLFKTT